MNLLIGILIPFLGTTLGSSCVFFMKNKMNKKVEKILLGFASGVMIAASVWSLLIPSIEIANKKTPSWFPAASGFLVGIISLLLINHIIPHFQVNRKKQKCKIKKITMMILAVTLHNIPEGMAVGVAFAGALAGNINITIAGATALSVGIAIQNFPEGAIISMPLKTAGESKFKAFVKGTLSGIVEPIGAITTIILTKIAISILPYMLSFAAGAMIYVVIQELIPESQKGKFSDLGTIGVAIGFILMMVLDVALG